ncbi:hypothetical protein K1T71_012702 [Dendrolimus kikuchii]|uniref:Uncharacterized protein n=1 Tax=Dendrolimus kikuchii TaxID=765133 RepID=A0ACC1CKI8_9NEOP|nr:hypothetical protein K1T71_012702 [Dendrolimus kikuchii]
MLITVKFSKSNVDLLKKLIEIRPLLSVRKYSQSNESNENIFKFYSDGNESSKHEPLAEEDYQRFISQRAARREPAITRLITSLSYKVGKRMISLAEGMPNEDVFPFKRIALEMKEGAGMVFEGKELAAALQYVPSQGLPALLSELRRFQEDLHRPPPLPRDILVINGGQHGIYQCVELLVEPGDPVITNEYAYTGIHSTLKPYKPEILGIPEDDDGLIPETLDAVLADRLSRGMKMPKMMYVTPTGSNPTGTVIPEERRRKIYELACRYDFLIVEDEPYMFLNYVGRNPPSFLSMDTCGRVIRLDSLSKVVSSGLRAAWLTAPTTLLHRLELHMQAELLHSCTLSQAILLQLLSDRDRLANHLKSTSEFYRLRRDALYHEMQILTDLVHCPLPSAGLFFWVKVNGVEDVYNMVFHTAFKRGLMLIPGQAFVYDSTAPCPYLRLTFSKIKYEDMKTAILHLSDIIRDEQRINEKQPQRVATES